MYMVVAPPKHAPTAVGVEWWLGSRALSSGPTISNDGECID